MPDEPRGETTTQPGRPLRIAALVKQVPVAESLTLGPDGRLERQGMALEMNAYCRRAVSKGVELARATGGTCAVLTLGPPSADDVLREAIAWGADRGLHLCDPAFAGSDTLLTARALAAALERSGPYDLVLVGRNSIDGDTGQVGPELAELTGLAFASGVRHLDLAGEEMTLQLEHDDGTEEAVVCLPAVLSVAERLCDPCKVPPEGREAVPPDLVERLAADDLGPGPWGLEGSPTRVGAVRTFEHHRARRRLEGTLEEQVAEALVLLSTRGALGPGEPEDVPEVLRSPHRDGAGSAGAGRAPSAPARSVWVLLEEGRPQVGAELLGAARSLAGDLGAEVVAFSSAPSVVSAATGRRERVVVPRHVADQLVLLRGAEAAEDVAGSLAARAQEVRPYAVLAPSTAFGREVAARVAAALGAGLVGDAIGLGLEGGELVAAKPAFSGALVADITCRSAVRLVTVRPGVLPVSVDALPGHGDGREAELVEFEVTPRRRVVSRSSTRDDDVEVLARADVVIGVGTGVPPDEYPLLSPLAALLGAELAATRKVTDKGWAPRSRQVGITGRSIAPRLYVAVGLSGKFNHMVGVRGAGTVLAVNADPGAPVFDHADVGIVGDWHEVLPLFEEGLRRSPATSPPVHAGD